MKRSAFQSTNFAKASLLGVALLTLLTSTSTAVQIPITNFSFEGPAIPAPPADQYINGLPTGWSSLDANNPFVETHAALGFTGGDGVQYGGLNGGGIYQDLGVPFQTGMAYRIDIAGAHRSQFTNGYMEFGIFSSNNIGTVLGSTGFIDIQGIWSGSGNPDGDDMYNVFRDASVLHEIGSGALGRTSFYTVGNTAPSGNVVVFIRQAGGFRLNFDNIRLDASPIVAGDVTGEGDVNLADYVVIRDHFRQNVNSRTMGDLNFDGTVDFTDFLEWRANSSFGNASFAQLNALVTAVPETSVCVLALMAFGALVMRRQR